GQGRARIARTVEDAAHRGEGDPFRTWLDSGVDAQPSVRDTVAAVDGVELRLRVADEVGHPPDEIAATGMEPEWPGAVPPVARRRDDVRRPHRPQHLVPPLQGR